METVQYESTWMFSETQLRRRHKNWQAVEESKQLSNAEVIGESCDLFCLPPEWVSFMSSHAMITTTEIQTRMQTVPMNVTAAEQ